MGKQKMEKHIEEALFCVSAGTNDFVISYFIIPERRKTFTIEAYQQFVIYNLKQFIQVNLYFLLFNIPNTFFFGNLIMDFSVDFNSVSTMVMYIFGFL